VFDRQPLFACRYYMADGHWQIYHHGEQRTKEGESETIACNTLRARSFSSLERGQCDRRRLYGVDIKTVNGRHVLMEVNDNPNSIAASGRRARQRAVRSDHEVFKDARRCRKTIQARRLTQPLRLFDAFGLEVDT